MIDLEKTLRDLGSQVLALRERGDLALKTKRHRADLQTAADRLVEEKLVAAIRSMRPDLGIRGEEGSSESSSTGAEAIIDPIDGTMPFWFGEDNFSISIGITGSDGQPKLGVLYFPAIDKLVTAVNGAGTRINQELVRRPPSERRLEDVLVGFDFSARKDQRESEFEEWGRPIAMRAMGIRIRGSFTGAVLEVLEGRWGAYVHPAATPFDIAASVIIAQEAGLSISPTWDLKRDFSPIVIAESSEILQEVRAIIFW